MAALSKGTKGLNETTQAIYHKIIEGGTSTQPWTRSRPSSTS